MNITQIMNLFDWNIKNKINSKNIFWWASDEFVDPIAQALKFMSIYIESSSTDSMLDFINGKMGKVTTGVNNA
jgi:hypothetical protein